MRLAIMLCCFTTYLVASQSYINLVTGYNAVRTYIVTQAKYALHDADTIPEPQRSTPRIVETAQQLTHDTFLACVLINRCQYYAQRLENPSHYSHQDCINAVRYLAYNGTPDRMKGISNRIERLAHRLQRMSDLAYQRA